jgi:hypothetical protein
MMVHFVKDENEIAISIDGCGVVFIDEEILDELKESSFLLRGKLCIDKLLRFKGRLNRFF